jgi:hypothetical protein
LSPRHHFCPSSQPSFTPCCHPHLSSTLCADV